MLVSQYILIAFTILGALVVFFISWSTIKGAPWAPTNKEKIRKMLAMADVKPDELVYDLGCGDGRVLIIAAREFNARAIGIEIDPFRFLWCKFRIQLLGLSGKVEVLYGNFFNKKLSNADIIFCYLLQDTNDKLQTKLIDELQSHARVVSNRFVFSKLNLISEDEEMNLYAYNMNLMNS